MPLIGNKHHAHSAPLSCACRAGGTDPPHGQLDCRWRLPYSAMLLPSKGMRSTYGHDSANARVNCSSDRQPTTKPPAAAVMAYSFCSSRCKRAVWHCCSSRVLSTLEKLAAELAASLSVAWHCTCSCRRSLWMHSIKCTNSAVPVEMSSTCCHDRPSAAGRSTRPASVCCAICSGSAHMSAKLNIIISATTSVRPSTRRDIRV